MAAIEVRNPIIYKGLDYVNKHVSSDTQRLVLGVSAIATQPLIDLCNKNVDDDTRWTSAMKTIAKITVGTAVGILVRRYAIKMVKKYPIFWHQAGDNKEICKYPGKDFWGKIDFSKSEHRKINDYANTVGTIIGTLTGIVTNFVIDAPLTNLTTNYLKENVQPICMAHFCKKNEKEE